MNEEYILFDLEWNSPFRYFNPKCTFEIMEIGAVRLDSTLRIVDTFKTYVRPVMYRSINPWVKKLTGIRNCDLQHGLQFPRAMKEFRTWMGREPVILASWGTSDIPVLKENCRYYNEGYGFEWMERYIDLQAYCGRRVKMAQPSLKQAATLVGVQFAEEGLHSALNDATLMAEVFVKSLSPRTLDRYIVDGDQYDEIPKGAVKIKGAMPQLDNAKLQVHCPQCGRFARNLYGWTEHGSELWALCYCSYCHTNLSCHVEVRPTYHVELEYKPRQQVITDDELFTDYIRRIRHNQEDKHSQADKLAGSADKASRA